MSEIENKYRKQELLPVSQIPTLVTPELVDQVAGMPPDLKGWANRNIQRGNRLSALVQAFLDSGIAASPLDALNLFSDIVGHDDQRLVITSVDLFNGDPEKEWREIVRSASNAEREPSDSALGDWGAFGTASHNAIRDLHGSRIPKITPVIREEIKQLPLVDFKPESTIFSMSPLVPLPAKQDDAFFPVLPSGVLSLPDGYLSYIEAQSNVLLEAFQDQGNDLPEIVDEMYGLLLPVYGEHISKLRQRRSLTARMLLAPAFLNWANALLEWYRGNPENHQILFTEAPLRDQGTSIGRIDAIEINRINGVEPSAPQRQILRNLSNQRYTDVAHAVHKVRDAVGKDIDVSLKEYKFSTGDNSKRRESFIEADMLEDGPFLSDVIQAQRYLVLATGLDFIKNDPSYVPSGWPEETTFENGELEYWIHTSKQPFRFDVSLSASEQLKYLNERISTKLGKAHVSAKDRRIINALSKHLKYSTERSSKPRKVNGNGKPANQPVGLDFSTDPIHQRTIRELLEAHRQFVDEGRVIEYTGTDSNNNPRYRFHLDAMLTGIRAGNIITTGLRDGARACFIGCLFPDHIDKSPSMHVWLDTGTVFCFSCARGGEFDADSVPDDFEFASELKSRGKRKKQTPEVAIETIPQEHFAAMKTANNVLQAGFRDNQRPQDYLAHVRGIDPGLAASFGVGYSHANFFTAQLRRLGMSEEDLIKYGFLYETRTGIRKDALAGRLSYPLEVEPGLFTNFYGRLIQDREGAFKHWKLSTRFTNVPQGIFNVSALYEDHQEIIAVEGTHDALALIQMGYPNVVAIIGTRIGFALDLLARSGKDIALGLDKQKADNKGKERELTAASLKAIEDFGHTGKRRDFTLDFMNRYPDFANNPDIKDFNEYMKTTSYVFRP